MRCQESEILAHSSDLICKIVNRLFDLRILPLLTALLWLVPIMQIFDLFFHTILTRYDPAEKASYDCEKNTNDDFSKFHRQPLSETR